MLALSENLEHIVEIAVRQCLAGCFSFAGEVVDICSIFTTLGSMINVVDENAVKMQR